MRKKEFYGIIVLAICLLIIQISPLKGVNFKENDSINDVRFLDYTETVGQGLSTYPEIDIDYIEIDGTVIILALVEPPEVNDSYRYKISITWSVGANTDHDAIENSTVCILEGFTNTVKTIIEHSTKGKIVDETIDDLIDPAGNTLVIPIQHLDLISNNLDPWNIHIYTQYRVGAQEWYVDEFSCGTHQLPGFTFWMPLVGIATITIIGLLIKRKKS